MSKLTDELEVEFGGRCGEAGTRAVVNGYSVELGSGLPLVTVNVAGDYRHQRTLAFYEVRLVNREDLWPQEFREAIEVWRASS